MWIMIGEKKREMRSPLPPGYIQNTHDRAQGGPAATARATYSHQQQLNQQQQQYYNEINPYNNRRAGM